MATIVKTPSGTWKAVIRKIGWPTTAKTFRTKRDAEDWARRTEDEMVRGVYLSRAPSEKLTVSAALKRYMEEVSVTKKPTTQRSERFTSQHLDTFFGKYSMAAVSAELVAKYRDERLVAGKSNNTVRIELAMLGHLFRIAIQEWGIGLTFNPVANIRKPSPGAGRDRRLTPEEQQRLFAAADGHSNPMLGWIVRLAVETGMRSSEITGLRRSQVDLNRRVVTLKDTKNGSARLVPLSRVPASYLAESTSRGSAMEAGFQATVGTAAGGRSPKDTVSIPYQHRMDRAHANTTFNANYISNTTTALRFPASLTPEERAFAVKCLAPFGTADAQDLLDELAAKLRAGKVQSNPLSYLAGLARKANAGEFVPTAQSTRAQTASGNCAPSTVPMDSRDHTTMMRQAIAKGILKNATPSSD